MIFLFFRNFLFSKRAGSVLKRTSYLTTVALILSISSLIIVMSVMTALNKNIQNRTLSVEPHFSIQFLKAKNTEELKNHPAYVKIQTHPEWRFHFTEIQDVILRTIDGKFKGAVAKGVTQPQLTQLLLDVKKLEKESQSKKITASEIDEITSVQLPEKEVDIGVDLAHGLGVFEGDQLLVIPPESLLLPPSEIPKYEKVFVHRILSTNLADVDAQNVFYLLDKNLLQLKSSSSRAVYLEVWTEDPFHLDSIEKELKEYKGIKFQSWQEKNSSLFFALKLEKLVMSLFLSIAAIIAGFSLISVLTLLISQKTRQIGLLQALGFSQLKIIELFTRIGWILSFIGIFGGVVIGAGLSLYLEFHPLQVLPDLYYDSQVPAQVDFINILMILLLASGLAMLGSWFAAKQASRFNPSEALRIKN